MRLYTLLLLPLLALAACQNGATETSGKGKTMAEKEQEAAALPSEEKSAALTETETPNKPATDKDGDVETEDLAALKAQLNALSGDLSRMRSGLADDTMATENSTIPDTQISTPRALVTDGIISIPDSKQEEAMMRGATIRGVRVGAHPDKTRLVFELSENPSRAPEVSLVANTLKIKLFDTKWPGGDTDLASQTKTLGVSSVTEELDNTMVSITLSHSAKLLADMVLPPADVGGPYRFVVDLGPES